MPSSEQSRPRKQQKTISAMEEPSVDTDDDDSMEMDVPYSHRNQKIREQQQTTREDTSQSKNIPPNNRADLAFVKDINDIAQVDTKGPTSVRCKFLLARCLGGWPSWIQSTHAGALQKKNDPSRWTSRTPQGDIQPTKWNHQLKKPASARQRGRGSTLFKMKFNLLCFQHGIDSYNAEEDSCSLFIQLSPDRVLATFYGETGKEKKVWGIDLTDVGAVAQVLVCLSSRIRPLALFWHFIIGWYTSAEVRDYTETTQLWNRGTGEDGHVPPENRGGYWRL